MEMNDKDAEQVLEKVYEHAANLLVNEKKTNYEVVQELVNMGIDEDSANIIVDKLEEQIAIEKVKNGKKDMLYGALWCIGGTVLTIADTGFIFWGAIVFGGYQFIKGAVNSQ